MIIHHFVSRNKNVHWYGEERRQGLDTNFRYISFYQSTDMVNWKFLGDPLISSDPDGLGRN